MTNGPRMVVAGGAGFLGSHLCERLLAKGCEVVCVDNLITGTEANLRPLLTNPCFQFIRHDIATPLMLDGPVHAVWHLASPASPVDYGKYPIQTLKVGALGTHHMLGLCKAKGAAFLLASTSEVYGDPQVNPQPESYWGHVNPIGPRGVYDEAKRFAEAMTMAYRRVHGVNTHIVRIFNSILADETVVLFNDATLHLEPIADYVGRLASRLEIDPPKIFVPAFDPTSCRITLAEVSAVTKHPCRTDCYAVSLRYGKTVKVTGDHSVFTRGLDGRPVAKPVRELRIGEYVAIPAYLPAVEKEAASVRLGELLIQRLSERELWDYVIQDTSLKRLIESRREDIHRILLSSQRFSAKRMRHAVVCASRKYRRESMLPLYVLKRLGVVPPPHGRIRMYKAGAHIWLPATILMTADLLWLIGLFIAEGSSHSKPGKSAFITLCSEARLVRRAKAVLERLGCHAIYVGWSPGRAPAVFVHSRLVYFLFDEVFGILREKRFPEWILQLPLSQLKHVLEGYREGDGTHSGKKIGKELCFDTTSERLATGLTYLLLRFGIVASVGSYTTTFRQRYGNRRFPFFRVTVCEVDNFNVLTWDQGVRQTLNARRLGDLVWSQVKRVERCEATSYVYDFSVPTKENFVAGNGVFCHNTYGPRMRLEDGRAIPTFIGQALRGEDLTVYGDGSQTRSFCYVDDLLDGLERLMRSDVAEPVNIGNPDEHTILEMAQQIIRATGSKSRLVFKPLPQDDPKTRRPDIQKARTLLGWAPTVGLDEGLRRTIAWFRGAMSS